jgi:alpha-2-macroglobulin
LQHTSTNCDAGISVRRNFITADGILTNVTTVSRGDLVWIEISIDPLHNEKRDLIIEDLLPAGLEIEMGSDQKETVSSESWLLHREIRDDRLLLFAKPISQRQTYTYKARAVTAGDFIVPAISASAMYDPGTFSRHGATRLSIK